MEKGKSGLVKYCNLARIITCKIHVDIPISWNPWVCSGKLYGILWQDIELSILSAFSCASPIP